MSRFFSRNFAALTPYTPGEQPQDKQYIKLNTNESPFPPSPRAQAMATKAAAHLELYPDPTCRALRERLGALHGLTADEVIVTNGSDEVLSFAFMAYGDNGVMFPDITYGFYRVFAQLYRLPYTEVPLKEDFTIAIEDYKGRQETVFIANPNAPTGKALSRAEIRQVLENNRDNVVVVDEAYVDFGAESAVPLVKEYDNLLVVQTFSKSRSMAGARLGYAFGNAAIIADLETIKYSTNPYNVNRLTLLLGEATVEAEDYYQSKCAAIRATRNWTAKALESLGFEVLPSDANFLFARSPQVSGETMYTALKKKGILVRHFTNPKISDFNRITIGTPEQMEVFITKVKEVLYENL